MKFIPQDPKNLKNFLRMDGDTFDDLLHLVGADLTKQDTRFKEAISAEERLAVTLRYLSSGMYSDNQCEHKHL